MTADSDHVYGVYGVTVSSDIPLPLPTHPDGALATVDVRVAPASYFADAIRGATLGRFPGGWYDFARLPDRSSYARWEGVGEYLVSGDGRRLTCRRFEEASSESFHVYLLGQALSFALVKRGLEPLHATAVVIDGVAAVFLGDSGFGKSSLAAYFLESGHRMLTDDMLIVGHTADGIVAYPGPPRIKLFPEIARRFLRDVVTGVPVNCDTAKLILPLDRSRTCSGAVPLGAIYALAPPRDLSQGQGVTIASLSPRECFLALVKNAFNIRLVEAERLARQFSAATRLISALPVKRLAYPRMLDRLSEVRDAVLSDLNEVAESGPALHPLLPSPHV